METFIAGVSAAAAIGAVIYASQMAISNRYAVKAAAFEERWRVYEDTRKFLSAWAERGFPDLTLLPLLIGAWDRSKYLFQPKVTHFLRQLWLDSIKAASWEDVMSGKYPGDRGAAIEKSHAMILRVMDDKFLFDVFYDELHISEPVRAGFFVIR